MHSHRFALPALLLVICSGSAVGADSSAKEASKSSPPPTEEAARARFEELVGVGPSTGEIVILGGIDPREPLAASITDTHGRQARMAELRERLAAGDPSAMEELRALVSRSDGESSGTVTSRGTMNWETMRAKLAELQARAAAGDPTVKIETQTRMTQRGPETTTTVSYPTAGASQKITRRSTSPSRATEMTAEEKARRQAYVASHPDLPARTKESILAGLFVLAMKFEDVEQLMGPLKPVEGPLPDGVALDPDVKVYTAQESGRTVYVLFRDGKLVRR